MKTTNELKINIYYLHSSFWFRVILLMLTNDILLSCMSSSGR